MTHLHHCTRCGEPIQTGERWEYTHGAYQPGEADTAPRIHSRCVAALIRETLAAFQRVPETKREEITFEV